ncbi:hypothetical protein [Achromobacter ruhlandii]|uniref:hypothetical protein n=1 Tax=Achromobacter ruhlandii TaxID=72557 RepID=UPI0020C5CC6A|nr:hypothetical protein [Achromobacter ruhlandii]
MRKQLCDALVARAANPDMVFLTGDLGFMALEPLQQALGTRFINAGVAEQNMVSVAAAMRAKDWRPGPTALHRSATHGPSNKFVMTWHSIIYRSN